MLWYSTLPWEAIAEPLCPVSRIIGFCLQATWVTEPPNLRRFILAFGGVGLFTLITGSFGVIGVATNRRRVLQTYVFLAIALLLVEVGTRIPY